MAAASTLFALLGPPLGALMINIYFLWPLTRPIGEYFSGGMVLIALMSLVVGYLVGIVPAAITGAAYAYSVYRIAHQACPPSCGNSCKRLRRVHQHAGSTRDLLRPGRKDNRWVAVAEHHRRRGFLPMRLVIARGWGAA